MSEHKHKTERIGRYNPDNGDIAFPNFRHWPQGGYFTPNAVNPRTGRPLPRVNHAKRALRAAQPKGTAL